MKKIIGIFIMTLFIITCIPVFGEMQISKSENNLELLQQGSGTVYTDKFVYQQGQSVHITFQNNGQDKIDFGGPPIFLIYRFSIIFLASAWGFIYPDDVGLVLYSLNPGASMTDIWNQKNSDGIQVLRGIYRLDIPYYDHFTNSQHVASDYFLIL